MTESLLRFDHVTFAYPRGAELLHDVTASFGGGFTALLGPNGAGKTTAIRLLLGDLKPVAGRVSVRGADLHLLNPRERAAVVAYVPQNVTCAFGYTVLEMVLLGAYRRSSAWKRDSILVDEAYDCLNRLGAKALVDRSFTTLSGGEARLVLLARALMQRAQLILLDEVTANLDVAHALDVLDLVRDLARSGVSFLLTSHDPAHCWRYADRLVMLKDGRLHYDGPPAEAASQALATLYHRPFKVCSFEGLGPQLIAL